MAGHARLQPHRAATAGTGPDRRSRRRPAGRARAGQDPAAAFDGRPARRVDPGDRRSGAGGAPLRPDHARVAPQGSRRGRSIADLLAAPFRALLREARHAGHLRCRPGRRRRPDEGGGGTPAGRPGDDPLRADPALAPRHRRHQRAARPRRTHPGVDAERDGGARHPDPRLRAPAAAGRARGGVGQPGGLHQPRPHHHAAEGPVRCGDPHPLPDRAGGRDRRHHPGGQAGGGHPRSHHGHPRPLHPRAAHVAGDQPALRGVGAVRDRRRGDRRRCRAAPGHVPRRGRGGGADRRPGGCGRRAHRQARVRVGRGGTRAGDPRPPAADGHGGDRPAGASAASTWGRWSEHWTGTPR